MNKFFAFAFIALLSSAHAADFTPGNGFFLNYDWMNKIVNKTPAKRGACPTLDVDVYGDGFKVALERSHWVSASVSASRWFPSDEIWASVGVGPVKNGFGISFGEIESLDQLDAEKNKKLPKSAEELAKWDVTDGAYWESQGGVSFYLGTGISPFSIGAFAVATGGWVNYLQKTGPNKVYVERAKKKIRSINLGVGAGYVNIGHERLYEAASGFSYEFTLDTDESIEAFERFMYGDVTKAQELSAFDNSGVMKIADTSEKRIGFSNHWGFNTPFIGLISFKSASNRSVDEYEENSVWDEKVLKNYGMYVKQRNTRIVGLHFKVAKSFMGGSTVKDVPGENSDRKVTENLYGNFKYSYQSDWGQERRLRKYIDKIKSETALTEETCVKVPDFKDSLGFNQVVLELKMKDDYIREIIGQGKFTGNFMKKIQEVAEKEQKAYFAVKNDTLDVCEKDNDSGYVDFYDCKFNTAYDMKKSFVVLESIANKMKDSYAKADKTAFSKQIAKFGEEIWNSPFVFKAFYEQGKLCGQDFSFEVSGQRITRHVVEQKYNYSESCVR
ncbi:MAG: hypothetical protein COW00_15080 [Bdellovibrio sp. CG12_big_fil_rev_8_21_14_0_65_39_13]|nr:MAG: hypothetical protein COW78_00635 [Bdellovibrio sp. CG22_combo_CG10-13_8_21_14_all_39_27]PIQ58615.1 MAG: hypothetical protein COW00_15080 [Bdellovibrio sp. CG12_big_fil_rev_8_21_14_0_65_39_13]PIR33823.1 MAG: hypothetical protein COV37_15040 [Bdellovibrio sp. CG11_big_fil_rev_8_21_14_0_20_39_38]